MMMPLLVSVMLQTAPLPPAAWKERNHPDMPVLRPCESGAGTIQAASLGALPASARAELMRLFAPMRGLADADGDYNSTDVIDGRVPSQRFLRAYRSGAYWIIWYERGGIGTSYNTIALRRVAGASGAVEYQAVPGSIFTGDLCVATKAILAGVRNGSP